MHTLISFSGASTKIPALYGASQQIKEKVKLENTVVCGVSAGGILASFYAMDLLDDVYYQMLDLKLSDIFSYTNRPVNSKGKITPFALLKIIQGKPYIGVMDNLETTIKSFITKDVFDRYVRSRYAPDCFVGMLNATTTEIVTVNIKSTGYEAAIKSILASAAMPLFTKGIEIFGSTYYDGALKDHTVALNVLKSDNDYRFKSVINVFARPKNQKQHVHHGNIISLLSNVVIGSFQEEISKDDDLLTQQYCKEKGYIYSPIYIDRYISHYFDTSKNKIGYELGVKAVKEQLKNERFI